MIITFYAKYLKYTQNLQQIWHVQRSCTPNSSTMLIYWFIHKNSTKIIENLLDWFIYKNLNKTIENLLERL